jgi:hypothetical protein
MLERAIVQRLRPRPVDGRRSAALGDQRVVGRERVARPVRLGVQQREELEKGRPRRAGRGEQRLVGRPSVGQPAGLVQRGGGFNGGEDVAQVSLPIEEEGSDSGSPHLAGERLDAGGGGVERLGGAGLGAGVVGLQPRQLGLALGEAGAVVGQLVRRHQRGHEEQAQVADPTHRARHLLDLAVELGGQLADVVLLAVLAADREGVAVDLDVDRTHAVVSSSGSG